MSPTLDFEPTTMRLRVDGAPVHLSPMEARAFAYLHERRGVVVEREALEREVWGLHPNTRTKTVQVTLRKVRNKLGVAGGALETVHGRGWRLLGQSSAPAPKPMAFRAPYLPRDAEEARVSALLDAGWRVVTLVGPNGVGKSRLAAEFVRGREEVWWWIDARSGDLADAIRTALGTHAPDLAIMNRSHGRLRLVLDGWERPASELASLMDALTDAVFLVTGVQPVGVAGEACHAVERFVGERGTTFLSSRVFASRWTGGEDLLERVVALLDGLPLALELAAVHPGGLESLVRTLEAGDLPDGIAPVWSAVETVIATLPALERQVLRQLALVHVPLRDVEITEWLGADTRGALHGLVRRSLVDGDGGWRVLSTVRVWILRSMPPSDAMRDRWTAWLVDRAIAWHAESFRRPEVAEPWGRLVPAMVAAVDRVGPDRIGRFVDALLQFFYLRGPADMAESLLTRAHGRFPEDALLCARMVPYRIRERQALLEPGLSSDDPYIRAMALEVQTILDPVGADEEATAAHPTEDPVIRVRLGRARAILAGKREGPAAGIALLESVIEACDDLPTLAVECLRNLAVLEIARSNETYATQVLDRALEHAGGRMPATELAIHYDRAVAGYTARYRTRGTPGPDLAGQLVGAGRMAMERGNLDLCGASGLLTAGIHSGAEALLVAGMSSRQRPLVALCRAVDALRRVWTGDPSARRALEVATEQHYLIHHRCGTPAGEDFRGVLLTELGVIGGSSEQRRVASRTLLETLPERPSLVVWHLAHQIGVSR